MVEPIGQRTYKLKDFKNPNLTFELIAENTNISRQIKSSLTLNNITYGELYLHFKSKIKQEEEIKKSDAKEKEYEEKTYPGVELSEIDSTLIWVIWLVVVIGVITYLLTNS